MGTIINVNTPCHTGRLRAQCDHQGHEVFYRHAGKKPGNLEQMEEVFADFPHEFELSNKYSKINASYFPIIMVIHSFQASSRVGISSVPQGQRG